MKKALLLVFCLILILQAIYIVWRNTSVPDVIKKRDPWETEGLAEAPATPAAPKKAAPPYPGPKATNPRMGKEMLRGIVTDVAGRPVAGATVLVDLYNPEDPLRAAATKARWVTESDLEGFFEFTRLPAASLTVMAHLDDRAAIAPAEVTEGGAAAEVRLRLIETVRVTGVVKDGMGDPLPGARVYPAVCDALAGRTPAPRSRIAEETDREGRFTFTDLRAGQWQFLVVARGYAPCLSDWVVPGQDDEAVEISLGEGSALTGSLVIEGTGKPVVNAEVSVVERNLGLESFRARTDAFGEFTLTGLRPADYLVTVRGNRAAPLGPPPRITVKRDENTMLPPIYLGPAGAVRGRAVLAEQPNRGVAGIEVRLQAGHGTATATTDQGGYYLFTALAPGDYQLAALPPADLAPAKTLTGNVTVLAQQRADGPTILLTRGFRVAGRVLDADGRPVPAANVRLNAEGRPGAPLTVRTSPEGDFTFEAVGPGEAFTIKAAYLDRQSAWIGPFTVEGEPLEGLALHLDETRDWGE